MTDNKDGSGHLFHRYLKQVLADPSLSALAERFIPRRIRRPGSEGELLSDDQALASVPRFALVGPPGCGKTSQLRHWMFETARMTLEGGSGWLPLYVDFTQVQEGVELDDLVDIALAAQGLDTTKPERTALLGEAVPLLLIDNLDRVRDIRVLQDAARVWRLGVHSPTDRAEGEAEGPAPSVVAGANPPRVVLACRTEAVSAYQGCLQGLPLASLAAIDDRTMIGHLLGYVGDQPGSTSSTSVLYWLWRDPALEGLARQPSFLWAVVDVAEAGHVSRAAVVERGIQKGLESSVSPDAQSPDAQAAVQTLASLAWSMRQEGKASVAGGARASQEKQPLAHLEQLLDSGLLRRTAENSQVCFAHPLLQAHSEAWAWQTKITGGMPLPEALQTICSPKPWPTDRVKGGGQPIAILRRGTQRPVAPGAQDVLLALFQLSFDKPEFLAALVPLRNGPQWVAHCVSHEVDEARAGLWVDQLVKSDIAPACWYSLGAALVEAGQDEAGRVALEQALSTVVTSDLGDSIQGLDKGTQDVAGALGEIVRDRWQGLVYGSLGQPDRALESFYKARDEVRMLHGEIWYQLARAQMGCGDFMAAVPLLQKAVLLRPTYADWHYEMAVAYNQIGKAERALAELQRAEEMGKDPDGMQGELARAYRALGQTEQALASFRRTCALEPRNPVYHGEAARLLAEQGEIEEAITTWRRALAWNPQDAEAHHALGQAYRTGVEMERALFHLSEAVRLDPEEAVYHFDLGECEAELGAWGQAVEHLRQAVQLKGGQVGWHEQLAGVLERQGLDLEGMEHYREAMRLEPEEARHYVALGRLLRKQGEYEEALACLRKALALRSGDGEIFDQLGQTYEGLGQEEEAISAYRRACELDSSEAAPHRALARVYLGRGDVIRAQGELRLAVRLDPTDVWGLTELSGVYEETGHLEDALEALEVAIRSAGSEEERAECQLRAGKLALRLGEVGGACGHLEEAVRLVPGRAEVHHHLGRGYQRRGELARAEEAYRRAMELAPEEAAYHAAVGEVAVELGELGEAREETAQAIALCPEEAAHYAQLGLIERKLGHLSAARERYQQAVALEPRQPNYHVALAQLYQVEGQREQSCRHLEVALAAEPERADLHLAWGEFHAEAGEMEEALGSFARAVELAPEELEYLDRYGRCLIEAGQNEAAIRQLQRVLAREPGWGSTHHSLGQALEAVGCLDEALRAYGKAAELLSGDDLGEALYSLGRLALRMQRVPEAIEALQQVVQLRPQWAEAHHYLSLALEDAQDVDGALLQAREAAQLGPERRDCHYHLGVLCNRLDLHDEAVSALERALTLPVPATAEVYFELGRAFEGKGEDWAREAVEEYRHAVQRAPQEPCYQHYLGILLARTALMARQDDPDKQPGAIDVLRNVTRLDPGDHEAHFYLGRVCLAQGLWEEAFAHCRKAAQLEPTHADYTYHVAEVLYQAGRHAEALEALGELPRQSPPAALLKGRCHEALGHPEVALAAYQQASALSSDCLGSWQQQGSLLSALGRWKDAARPLERALQLAEERGDRALQAALHRQLGRTCKELSQPEAALVHLQQVVALDGGDEEAYYLVGSLLAEQGESAAAIGALKQATDLKPSFAQAHFSLGQLYEQRGNESDMERALVSYGQAAQHAPEQPAYLRAWARMLCTQGKGKEAVPILHRVLEMDPQDAEIHYLLGKVEETLGHLERAHTAYDAAATLVPDKTTFLQAKALALRRLLQLRLEDGEPAEEAHYEELTGLWQRIMHAQGEVPPLVYRERGLAEAMFGRDQKAARDLAQALALAPEDALLHGQRAQVLQRLGRHQEALADAMAARRLEPEEASNHHLLAQCHVAMGSPEQAVEALAKAIELAPSRAIYHHDLAEALARLDQTEDAAHALERAITLEPNEHSWHHRLGALRSLMNVYPKAAEAHQRAVELNPGDPMYQHDLAEALITIGHLPDAAAALEQAVALAPQRNEWLLQLGQLHEQLQNYELAHQRYAQAAELHQDEPEHLIHLARSAYLADQEEEATGVLLRAIELTEDWAPPFEALGDLHTHYGRHREAVEAYLQAVTLEPNKANYSFKLGQALHQSGEYEQAIVYLERAATVDPHRAVTYVELGDVYRALERYDEAMQSYQQAAVIAPDELDTLFRLASLCHQLGYLDQAHTHFRSLAELDPNQTAVYARLGAVCADQGDFEEALHNYLQAIQMEPDRASHHYQAGLAYKQLREYKKAGQFFRQTVRLDPNNRDAYKQFAAVSALSFLGQ